MSTDKNQNYRRSPAYYSWEDMKKRCNSSSCEMAHRYSDRGVSYDSRWEYFSLFYADMGPRPEGTTLDRIDNDKGYSKGNCKWSTPKEQANNRSDNVTLTHNGVTQTKAQWANSMGATRHFLQNRLDRGWSVEKALNTPVRKYSKEVVL